MGPQNNRLKLFEYYMHVIRNIPFESDNLGFGGEKKNDILAYDENGARGTKD